MSIEAGFINRDGIKLHYFRKENPGSTSDITLLFLSGGMMPAWIWEDQLTYFSGRYRCIAMDARSHGESSQTSEGHYAEARADDIRALIEQLHLDNVVLIGWSLAVSDVVMYLHRHKEKNILGAVLVDGLVGIDRHHDFFNIMLSYWMEYQKNRLAITEEFVRGLFSKPMSEEYIDRLVASVMKVPTNTAMTLLYNYILFDQKPLLPKIECPVLIFTIDAGWLDIIQEMHQLIPNSKLEIVHDSRHAIFIDQEIQFQESLDNFLAKLSDNYGIPVNSEGLHQ